MLLQTVKHLISRLKLGGREDFYVYCVLIGKKKDNSKIEEKAKVTERERDSSFSLIAKEGAGGVFFSKAIQAHPACMLNSAYSIGLTLYCTVPHTPLSARGHKGVYFKCSECNTAMTVIVFFFFFFFFVDRVLAVPPPFYCNSVLHSAGGPFITFM